MTKNKTLGEARSASERRWLLKAASPLGRMAIVGLTMCSTVAVQAQAQDAAREQGQSSAKDRLDVIVVTATKREQSLQDIPISVSALGREELEARGIEDAQDLALAVPSLILSNVNSTVGSANVYLRGIGTEVRGVGVDSAVAIYVDGVYSPRGETVLRDFLDVERVEVLRGPQGTLYGRNATGGAINIISKRPDPNEFSFNGDILYGRFDNFRTRASVNIPVAEGAGGIRLAITRQTRDSYTENLERSDAGLDSRVRDADLWAGRMTAAFDLSDSFEVFATGFYVEDDAFSNYPLIINPNSYHDVILPGPLKPIPQSPFQIRSNILDPVGTLENYGGSFQATWDAGFATVKSITGFEHAENKRYIESDGTEVASVENASSTDADSFSQELTFDASLSDNFDVIFGLNYFDENGIGASRNLSGSLNYATEVDTKAFGIYGEATLRLGDYFSIVAGLRYSDETKDLFLQNLASSTVISDTISFNGITPRVILNYEPNQDVLIYASASKGFKSGGFSVSNGDRFAEEELWAYELGAKTAWLDGRLTANGAIFFYDYSSIQVPFVTFDASGATGGGVFQPNAELYGGEVELAYRPTPNTSISMSAAALEAEAVGDFFARNPITGMTANLNGRTLPRAPEFMFNVSAQHDFDLGGAGSLTPRIDFTHSGRQFLTLYNNSGSGPGDVGDTAKYDLLNLRLTWTDASERYSLSGFINNVTDEAYKSTSNSTLIAGQVTTFSVYAPPQTWGVQLGFRF